MCRICLLDDGKEGDILGKLELFFEQKRLQGHLINVFKFIKDTARLDKEKLVSLENKEWGI